MADFSTISGLGLKFCHDSCFTSETPCFQKNIPSAISPFQGMQYRAIGTMMKKTVDNIYESV
jgi:hypothetical protein